MKLLFIATENILTVDKNPVTAFNMLRAVRVFHFRGIFKK
jgi:hypothetical protein